MSGSTINSNPKETAPKDTVAVQRAKLHHQALYEQIAASHQALPEPVVRQSPKDTKAVQSKRNEHATEFQRIAALHARIEAEHATLAAEENARYEAEIAAGQKFYSNVERISNVERQQSRHSRFHSRHLRFTK